ncbi:hypothetical protein HYR53_04340 [Candidatus Acetothermia bacterium]|nr:hypothetical protein [Candidatus Acetothermia bacterium]
MTSLQSLTSIVLLLFNFFLIYAGVEIVHKVEGANLQAVSDAAVLLKEEANAIKWASDAVIATTSLFAGAVGLIIWYVKKQLQVIQSLASSVQNSKSHHQADQKSILRELKQITKSLFKS